MNTERTGARSDRMRSVAPGRNEGQAVAVSLKHLHDLPHELQKCELAQEPLQGRQSAL
jgi:hypothetical protein